MVDSVGVRTGVGWGVADWGNVSEFRKHCRLKVINIFINMWYNDLNVTTNHNRECIVSSNSVWSRVKSVQCQKCNQWWQTSALVLISYRMSVVGIFNRRCRLTFDFVKYAILSKMRNIFSLNMLSKRTNDHTYWEENEVFILMLIY